MSWIDPWDAIEAAALNDEPLPRVLGRATSATRPAAPAQIQSTAGTPLASVTGSSMAAHAWATPEPGLTNQLLNESAAGRMTVPATGSALARTGVINTRQSANASRVTYQW